MTSGRTSASPGLGYALIVTLLGISPFIRHSLSELGPVARAAGIMGMWHLARRACTAMTATWLPGNGGTPLLRTVTLTERHLRATHGLPSMSW
jgi:hypothetical protein